VAYRFKIFNALSSIIKKNIVLKEVGKPRASSRKHQLVRKEFMRASKLIDDAAAQRVDPDLVLDYICEPLPAPDQVM